MRVWVQKYEADAAVTLAAKAIAGQGGLFGDVAETQGAALEKLRAVVWRERASDACPRPHEAYNIVTAPHERAHVARPMAPVAPRTSTRFACADRIATGGVATSIIGWHYPPTSSR
jgi:hypothetical protein